MNPHHSKVPYIIVLQCQLLLPIHYAQTYHNTVALIKVHQVQMYQTRARRLLQQQIKVDHDLTTITRIHHFEMPSTWMNHTKPRHYNRIHTFMVGVVLLKRMALRLHPLPLLVPH